MLEKIEFSSMSRRFLKKLDSKTWGRIIRRIEKLQDKPFPSDSKRIVGRKEKTFRIRVGSYRILYSVFTGRSLLFIVEIDKRGKIYRR